MGVCQERERWIISAGGGEEAAIDDPQIVHVVTATPAINYRLGRNLAHSIMFRGYARFPAWLTFRRRGGRRCWEPSD